MSNNLFKGVIKLTQEQFDTLRNTGKLTVGEETINYSPNDTMYVVEDNISEQVVINTNDITQLKTDISDLETDITKKLDKNQGVENAGKTFMVGQDGNAVLITVPTMTTETQTIESTSWSELSNSSPYTYSATITASTTIGTDSIVELINNQAVLFATYGFAIGSISGQNITVYSIGQPSTSVTLTVGVTG